MAAMLSNEGQLVPPIPASEQLYRYPEENCRFPTEVA